MKEITVIILTRNEILALPQMLNQWLKIIDDSILLFVDGKSDDGTMELLSTVETKNITLLINDSSYTSAGINLGILKSSTKHIAISGIRSVVSSSYIRVSTEILSKNISIGCVGGRIIHTAHTSTGKAIAKAMGANLGMGILSFRSMHKSGYTDTVSVPVFRRDVVEKVGLFDEKLIRNQDDDYSYRLKKSGYKIWHEASISSTYYVREKFSQLAAQFFQYGFWKNYVNKKHKTITTARQLAPPLFLLALLVLFTLNPLYGMATIAAYCTAFLFYSIGLNHFKLTDACKTFVAFAIMHFSYGIGYWYGCIFAFVLNKPAPSFVKKITR